MNERKSADNHFIYKNGGINCELPRQKRG